MEPTLSNHNQVVPELLAPAGGIEQFFAALNAGADAVFLGLKEFNARARAANFTLDDLQTLLPVARRFKMKVLVTVNVLIKEIELSKLLETLSALESLEVDAIIVQDLGVARIAREHFPGLRLHASTQMAVHNLAGVLQAAAWGFKRVVLARELTAQEIRKIRAAVPRELIELEAFCHGSLCYSYSGLCFFSGSSDGRSGNRGECAYTCREPYKIISEPGHGFLFSMRDLDTATDINLLAGTGIDTLKIEGRKKDAQYVGTVVRLYREALDQFAKGDTSLADEAIRRDLAMSYNRRGTKFFLAGRYHENVIDLENQGHLGERIGTVRALSRSGESTSLEVELTPGTTLERFDGIRIVRPLHSTELSGIQSQYQNESLEFSARELKVRGQWLPQVSGPGSVSLGIPEDKIGQAHVNDHVYRLRSAELKRKTEKLSQPPADVRLRPLLPISISITFNTAVSSPNANENQSVQIHIEAKKFSRVICSATSTVDLQATARQGVDQDPHTLQKNCLQLFETFGDAGFTATTVQVSGADGLFVPPSKLKELKRQIASQLPAAYQEALRNRLELAKLAVLPAVAAEGESADLSEEKAQAEKNQRCLFAIKVDRLESLQALADIQGAVGFGAHSFEEVVFEPKRAFLTAFPNLSAADLVQKFTDFNSATGVPVRFSLPTVIRAWDEPLLMRWAKAFISAGFTRFEVGNAGAFELLKTWSASSTSTQSLDIRSDFTLYSLNHQAMLFWSDQGVKVAALSIEDDIVNLSSHLRQLKSYADPEKASVLPQVILYKDTPLFIAEACSLTALHNGCPTSAVCGYRTLTVENRKGERFHVAHESCKSVVYGEKAFSWTADRKLFTDLGVQRFRLDFLTRPYDREAMATVIARAVGEQTITGTHSANLHGELA